MSEVYLVNQADNREYHIISYDQETQQIVLEGPHGRFTETFNKELFKKLNYKMIKKEVEMEDA